MKIKLYCVRSCDHYKIITRTPRQGEEEVCDAELIIDPDPVSEEKVKKELIDEV